MSFLQLASGASYGLVGDRPVFLDLRRDRYFALDAATEADFLALRSAEEPVLAAGPARDRLLATGLFREHALRARLAPVPVPVPAESLLDTPGPRGGWASLPRVWSSLARARQRLAAVSLFDIVEDLRERRHAGMPAGEPTRAEDAARGFLAARPLVPVARSCLLDSLALLDWLGDQAGHARLVFGVRLDPFGAHCWLQTGRVLLTDAPDTANRFAPVLAV